MDKDAFNQYKKECNNWLHRSRRDLMYTLLTSALNNQNNLSVLEIGAGVGQNTIYLQKFGKIDVVEINEAGVDALHSIPNINTIITKPVPFVLNKVYDLIVAMDILEHLQNDGGSARWMIDGLRNGGLLFLTLPAYQWLFSEHDVAVHHFRRYSIRQLKQLLPRNVKIVRMGYFNTTLFPMVALLRFYNLLVLRFKKSHPEYKARKQRNLLPKHLDAFFRFILKIEIYLISKGLNFPYGLSIFCIAKKL